MDNSSIVDKNIRINAGKARDIWISSDWHLFHGGENGEKGILEFKGSDGQLIRPGFDNINQMHEALIEGHNSVVKPGSIHYNLGDVCMFNARASEGLSKILPKFNGSSRLIPGNHDDPKTLVNYFKKISVWRIFADHGVVMTHIPIHRSSLQRHGIEYTNIHGHIHQNLPPEGPYVNVSMEQLDGYKPVHIEDIKHLWKQQQEKVSEREKNACIS